MTAAALRQTAAAEAMAKSEIHMDDSRFVPCGRVLLCGAGSQPRERSFVPENLFSVCGIIIPKAHANFWRRGTLHERRSAPTRRKVPHRADGPRGLCAAMAALRRAWHLARGAKGYAARDPQFWGKKFRGRCNRKASPCP